MIDISTEQLIDLRRACREPIYRNPTSNKSAHISSVYRHVQHGARAISGERVRLEAIKTPSGLRTSREAIQRFIERLTDPAASGSGRSPAHRRRAIEAAKTSLKLAGV